MVSKKRNKKAAKAFFNKAMHSAKATLADIELHHMLKKQQHKESANQTISEQFYALAA